MPTFREHKIPSAGSKPYILTFTPGHLWVCESGAGKIGRLALGSGRFDEFAVPTPESRPIGITVGGDGNLWFTENGGHKIGRITPQGVITEFPLPTPKAGPDGLGLGPDGNVWFAERDAGQVGRITPDGRITEFGGFPADARPLAPMVWGSEIWWSDPPGSRIFRMTLDGRITGQSSARPGGGPRAMQPCSDGGVWFVLAESHAMGRIDPKSFSIVEFPLPRATIEPAQPRGIRRRDLVHRRRRQPHRPHEFRGQAAGRISRADGERRPARDEAARGRPHLLQRIRRGRYRGIRALSDGRLFSVSGSKPAARLKLTAISSSSRRGNDVLDTRRSRQARGPRPSA